jgi:hypothetical protein
MVPPTDEQISKIVEDLEIGLSLRDAAQASGLDYARLQQSLSGAARNKGGVWKDLRQKIQTAQALYRRKAARLLLESASKGNNAAISALVDRLKKADDGPGEDPPTEREAFLRWRLYDVRRRMDRETGIAYNQLRDAEAKLLTELEQHKTSESRGAMADASPEQRQAYNREDAATCSLDDLEAYVAEWCRRHKLDLVVKDGMPQLTRAGALG